MKNVLLTQKQGRRGRASGIVTTLIAVAAGLIIQPVALSAELSFPVEQVLTNADIVNYSLSRVDPAQIIAKISSSRTDFDLSPSAVIALKDSGVPDDVLAVMSVAASRASARPAFPALPSSGSDASGLPPLPQTFAQPSNGAGDAGRYTTELATLHSGSPDAQTISLAWMLANRDVTLPRLRQTLAGSIPEEQAAAILVLGRMKDQASLGAIRALIASSHVKVRHQAATALAELGDVETIRTAEQALTQPSLSPLDGYIRLVGAARLVRATRELGVILADNTSAVNRAAAAWALAEIGPPAAAAWPAVQKALADDPDADVRREAARAVASLHGQSSATLLIGACRRDPDVRKVTLQAMADYPEAIEFLVGVMKLGEDQIAPDELAAARSSLQKLTGQDFALDGDRWSDWYAQNASRLVPPAATDLALPPGTDDLSQLVGELHSGLSELSASVPDTRQPTQDVDVSAWGIVVDSTQIPMAPEVDAISSVGAGLAGAGITASDPAAPLSGLGISTYPVGDTLAQPTDGAGAFSGGDSLFRTWRSEPEPPAQTAAGGDMFGPAGPGGPELQPGETQVWGGPVAGPGDSVMAPDSFSGPSSGGNDFLGAGSAGLPSHSAAGLSAAPSSAAPESAAPSLPPSPLSGMSLPLPPMGDISTSTVGQYDTGPAPVAAAAPVMVEPAPVAATPDASPYGMPEEQDPFGSLGSAPTATDNGTDMPGDAIQPWTEVGGMGMAPAVAEPLSVPATETASPLDFSGPDWSTPEASSTTPAPEAAASFDDWHPYDGPTGDDAQAAPPAASGSNDYNTLIFPGDSFGLGDPYIEQTEQPRFDTPPAADAEQLSLPLGGLSLPGAAEEPAEAPPVQSLPPPPLGSLRPPASSPTPVTDAVMEPATEVVPEPATELPAGLTGVSDGAASSGSPLFVEPSPDQIVVGEDLFESPPSAVPAPIVTDESAPAPGLALPMPGGVQSPADEADVPAALPPIPVPVDETPAPVAAPVEIHVAPEYEEPAAIVMEVEELGVVGEGGVIIQPPAEAESDPMPAAPSEAGEEGTAGIVTAAPELGGTPSLPESGTVPPRLDKYEHNEPAAAAPVPEGVIYINEEDIYTDPSPEYPEGAVVPARTPPEPAVTAPAAGKTEPTKARRKRNPPRHKRN